MIMGNARPAAGEEAGKAPREAEARAPQERVGAAARAARMQADLARTSGELVGLNRALAAAEEASRRADIARQEAVAEATALRTTLNAAQAEMHAQRERASRALGELEGVKLATEHQHAELAQMRREVAEAHNRAVTAEQEIIEATRLREGAEVALAKARSWNFLNFLFGREGKGRQ